MDRRQAKTKQAVYEAFTRLLEKKSYSRISIQEIIDEANIGRSTFYAHFETKDDLLKALCKRVFDHVFSKELMKESTHDFSSSEGDLPERITHFLYHLQDNRSYLRGLLSGGGGEVLLNYLKEYLTVVIDESLTWSDIDVPRDYLVDHTVCSFAETIRWWFEHEEYSPENVAEFFLSTAPYLADNN